MEALTAYLENITTVLTSAVSWTGAIGDMVTSTPMMLVPVVLGVGLVGISIVKSFIR